MSNKLKYLSLLILPVLLFLIIGLLKSALGPYYFNFSDPSYTYLFNSMSVALRFPVGQVDHPGTTVQVIGAVVIKIYYWISSAGNDLTKDVMSRPEEYLSRINMILVLIGSITLFLIGVLAYKLSGSLLLSLLIQLSPFISNEILYGYKIVASDNFLITVTLCFTGILMYYLFKVKSDAKSPLPFIIAFAVICAFGLVTKISFFPMLIIPLILIEGRGNKLLFLLILAVSFLILVLPAISNYEVFIKWVWSLFLKSGSYGQGDPNVVDLPKFFTSLRLILTGDLIFTASYILSIAALLFVHFRSKRETERNEQDRKEFKLLLSIVIAITIQVIIVAKHYRQHYMIPSFILSMFTFSLCTMLLSSYIKKLKAQAIYAGIIICVTVICSFKIYEHYKATVWLSGEANKVNRYVKEHNSDALMISSFGSANKEFALAWGIYYSGKKKHFYKSILSTIQRENIFYIPWSDEFFSLSSRDSVRKELQDNNRIIFQTNQGNVNEFIRKLEITYGMSNISKKLLYSNSIKEEVYEITTRSTGEE